MKKIALIISLILVSAISIYAQGTGFEDALDRLAYTDYRIAAVSTDMVLYFGWLPEEKDSMKEGSIKAIVDLKEIKNDLLKYDFPPELIKLKEENAHLIDRLQAIYDGVEKKNPEDVGKEFASFNEAYSKYQENLMSAARQYKTEVKLPEKFDSTVEEIKLIDNQKDKDDYSSALAFIKNKDYKKAYNALKVLQKKYAGTVFENCVLLRISDCMLMREFDAASEPDKFFRDEKGISLLSKILHNNEYSPVLYEAFYKWRTSVQSFYHGMSNMSEIPNKKYNEKRWVAVQIIRQYLTTHPNDQWAKAQADLLLSLPNIERGGTMGNLNLNHWGALYTDILSKEKKK